MFVVGPTVQDDERPHVMIESQKLLQQTSLGDGTPGVTVNLGITENLNLLMNFENTLLYTT